MSEEKKASMARYLIPLIIFVILVGFFAVGLNRDPRLVPSPLVTRHLVCLLPPGAPLPAGGGQERAGAHLRPQLQG
jgi:hypothetical protein